jgi:hypothetical protein
MALVTITDHNNITGSLLLKSYYPAILSKNLSAGTSRNGAYTSGD